MNKRLVSGSILFLVVLFAISLAWDNHLHVEEDLKRPNDFGCETRNSRFICIMGIERQLPSLIVLNYRN